MFRSAMENERFLLHLTELASMSATRSVVLVCFILLSHYWAVEKSLQLLARDESVQFSEYVPFEVPLHDPFQYRL
jgi:hypothetical protein